MRNIICTVFLVFSLSLKANENHNISLNDSSIINISKIYYPVNKVTVYENYMNNPAELENIKLHLEKSSRIDSITIYSYASPEGPYSWNVWLARERGKTAKRYILSHVPKTRNLPPSLIKVDPTPENWTGMRREVVKLYNRPDKEQVLEIIDRKGIHDEYRKHLLKQLDGGKSWRFILRNIMPQLRHATWIAVWAPVEKTIATLPPDTSLALNPSSLIGPLEPLKIEPVPIAPEARDTVTILALKTNMLYDAITWFNFAVEVPFSKHFSVLYYHQFPWWRWGESRNEYCNRFLSIGGEARWWFKPQPRPSSPKLKKRDRLMGHFLGLYGESGKWDFEHKRDICYQGEHWSAGISYGYSMPISRHLNLEFSVSAGYASIAYRGYTPSPDYSILWRDYAKTGRWHYFGPTKAQISLVVPFRVSYKKKNI